MEILLLIIIVIPIAAYIEQEILSDGDKHPLHNDNRPGSFWYNSHKKEDYNGK